MGKLIWPVKALLQAIWQQYAHPVLKNIYTTNNGIDISTEPNSSVQSIFDGKVLNILFNPSFHWAVIIKHGNYFTVYTHLRELSVAKNDMVKMNQTIGTVNSKCRRWQNRSTFGNLGRSRKNFNPSKWLRD